MWNKSGCVQRKPKANAVFGHNALQRAQCHSLLSCWCVFGTRGCMTAHWPLGWVHCAWFNHPHYREKECFAIITQDAVIVFAYTSLCSFYHFLRMYLATEVQCQKRHLYWLPNQSIESLCQSLAHQECHLRLLLNIKTNINIESVCCISGTNIMCVNYTSTGKKNTVRARLTRGEIIVNPVSTIKEFSWESHSFHEVRVLRNLRFSWGIDTYKPSDTRCWDGIVDIEK